MNRRLGPWLLLLCCSCGGDPGSGAAPAAAPLPAPFQGANVESGVSAAFTAAHDLARTDPTAAHLGAYGQLLQRYGWFREAADVYGRAAAAAPGEYRWPYLRGIALLTVDAAAAHESLERAVALDPGYAVGHYTAGVASVEAGDGARARQHFAACLERQPDHVPSLLALGRLDLADGDVDGALRTLRRAADLAPDHPEVHEALAKACFRAGDREGSARHAELARLNERAVPLVDPRGALDLVEPVSSRDFLDQGVAAAAERRFDQAIAAFERALALRADSYEALYNLGLAWRDKGDPTRAEDYFRRCLALRPENPSARAHLGLLLLARGAEREAIEQFEHVLARDPEQEAARQSLANAALSLAARALQAAWILASTPDDAARDPARALALAEQAAAANDQAVVLDTYAVCLAANGRFAEAATQAERALAAAQKQGNAAQAGRIEQRLALFRDGKEFRAGKGR